MGFRLFNAILTFPNDFECRPFDHRGVDHRLHADGNEWGYLDMLDGTPLSSGHLLKPFENQLFKTLGVLVLQAVYVILWSVLLIIPGIMKLYALALSNFIYFDNPDMKTTDILRQSEAFMKGKR